MDRGKEITKNRILNYPSSGFSGRDQPPLHKWGKTVTQHMFAATSYGLSPAVKLHLLAIEGHLKGSRQHECRHLYIQRENTGPVIACLPYLLGFSCEVGRISISQVDLRAPVLVIATCTCTLQSLQKHLCSQTMDGNKSYLRSNGFLSNSEMKGGACFHIFVVATMEDTLELKKSLEHHDIILTTKDMFHTLPVEKFALVLVDENCAHSSNFSDKAIRRKFQDHAHILIFRNFKPSDSVQRDKKKYPLPMLTHFSSMITTKRISSNISPAQLTALRDVTDRIRDSHSNHIPIAINMATEVGMNEMICVLPYLLGDAAYHTPGCLDLTKPLLLVTTDLEAWVSLRKVLSSHSEPYLVSAGLMTKEEYSEGGHYRWHRIKDLFEVCTYSRDIYDQELVLITMDTSYLDDEDHYKCQTSDCYLNLPSNQFSAVIVFENERTTSKKELDIILKFTGTPTILFRVDIFEAAGKSNVQVESKIHTVNQYGADTIFPKLPEHDHSDITSKYLLGRSSTLNDHQKAGLVVMIDWLTSAKSLQEPAYINTAMGYEKAVMMLWCLQPVLEWAHSNHLLRNTDLDLNKPLLVLYNDKESFNTLTGIFSSSPPYQQTSVFTTPSSKSRAYVVPDPIKAKTVAGELAYKMILSDLKYLHWLPHKCFLTAIVFSSSSEHFVGENKQEAVKKKFGGTTKVIFFEAFKHAPRGPPVPFLLLSEADNLNLLKSVRRLANAEGWADDKSNCSSQMSRIKGQQTSGYYVEHNKLSSNSVRSNKHATCPEKNTEENKFVPQMGKYYNNVGKLEGLKNSNAEMESIKTTQSNKRLQPIEPSNHAETKSPGETTGLAPPTHAATLLEDYQTTTPHRLERRGTSARRVVRFQLEEENIPHTQPNKKSFFNWHRKRKT